MSWFSLMAYLEASEANSRISALESSGVCRTEEIPYDAGKSLGEELVNLLQELYKNNNNIANIDLSNISAYDRSINNHFVVNNMTTRPIKYERQEKRNIVLLFILFIVVMYSFSGLWLKVIAGTIIVIFILSNWADIKGNRRSIKNYDLKQDQYIEHYRDKLYVLKKRFPNLTARGVFFKYIIDDKCKSVIELLQKDTEYGNPLDSLQVLYGLFDLKADTSFDYPVDTIKAMNADLVAIYNTIESKDIDSIPPEAGKKTDALERASIIYPGSKFEHFHSYWKKDRDVVLAAVRHHPAALEFVDSSFKKDRYVVLASLENISFPGGLKYADISIREDKEIVTTFIERSAFNIDDAGPTLKKDKDFVMKIFGGNNYENGYALMYVDDSLKNDKEVVLAAVRITGDALEYASDELKADKEVVIESLTSFGDSYQFVDKSLKNDLDILLAAQAQTTIEDCIEQSDFEEWCEKQGEIDNTLA